MKAIVDFEDGTSCVARVNTSYSQGGIHYYNLTLSKQKSWLDDFEAGITKLFTGSEIKKLRYIMG